MSTGYNLRPSTREIVDRKIVDATPEPAIDVSPADLMRLHDEMRAVVEASERVQRTIETISHGDQAAMYLKGNLMRGAGYFRISADTICRLFRARNSGK